MKNCYKPTKYGHIMFCEAVKVKTNSKETLFSNTISSSLSLITVLFEDLFEAFAYTRNSVVKRRALNHPSHY